MGYRSEVAIRCEEAAFRILKATCAEVNLLPDKCYKADDGTFVLYFDWVKWYDDYKDVSAIMHVLSQLDDLHDPDSDDGFGYKYLRLGESDGDTEERDNDPDIELWQIRSIDLPACADEIKIEKEKEQIMDLNFDFFRKNVERNFMKYAPAEYQDAKFEMRTIEKINGQREAVIVTQNGAGAAPCLYIDSMYDRYKELDGEFDATMRETWEFLMKVAKGSPDTDMVHGLLEKSDDIIFRVVNTAANKELLSNCPHREFLDLSFVYYKS